MTDRRSRDWKNRKGKKEKFSGCHIFALAFVCITAMKALHGYLLGYLLVLGVAAVVCYVVSHVVIDPT